MIDRAEPNLTTIQLYSIENHYPPRVSIAPSRPSLLPLVTGRSVSVLGTSCSGSPCAPLHTLHRCGSIHSRGATPIIPRETILLPRPLCSPCSPLLLLVWASSLVQSQLDARSTFTGTNAHLEDKWSVSRQCWHILPCSWWANSKDWLLLGTGPLTYCGETMELHPCCKQCAQRLMYLCACAHNTHRYHTFGLLTGLKFII